jgi:protein gp37
MNNWTGTHVDYTVPGLAEVELYLDEKALLEPLSWRKPKQVFVCSMTDLFADFVPDEWIGKIYAVMAEADKHTFMVLTKRPSRRLKWYSGGVIPLKNVREGTSICTQKEAFEHIPVIGQTPAELRWLSIEPLLEDITLPPDLKVYVKWVVVGGESGTGARKCDTNWIRSIIRQCKESKVPCFVKQLGRNATDTLGKMRGAMFSHAKGGDINEWPHDLRVRQFPEVL